MNSIATTFFALAAFVLSPSLWAQSAPADVEILSHHLSGSGCDFDQVSVSLSPDAKDLSLLFDNYIAEIGSQSQEPHLMQKVKECLIHLSVRVPRGWQMAFKSVDYRGFVLLPQVGVSAFQRFVIQQEGAPVVSLQEANLTGPMNADYYKSMTVRPERLTWSRCLNDGQTQIVVGSQMGVRLNPRAPVKADLAMISLDSSDLSFQQNLSVEWRRCGIVSPPAPPRPPVVPRPPRYRGR